MKKISTIGVTQTRSLTDQRLTIGLDLGDRSSWLGQPGDKPTTPKLQLRSPSCLLLPLLSFIHHFLLEPSARDTPLHYPFLNPFPTLTALSYSTPRRKILESPMQTP